MASMTEPPENRAENSGEVPARIEDEAAGANGGDEREVESRGYGLELESGEASGGGAPTVDNGGSSSPGLSVLYYFN